MKKRFLISRAGGPMAVIYETEDPAETVANALARINERLEAAGEKPVRWEHSCLQKKCGACAMVIDGRPGLACDARLNEYGETIRLEPLRKFPVVEDLLADRSVLFENLRALRVWLEADVSPRERAAELAYEASRCLQCGCCLEVCPNFAPGERFAGMAAAVPLTRLLAEADGAERRELSALYRKGVFAGCGKSLACRNICPAGIDIDRMLVNSNAVAVWKRFIRD